MQRVFRRYTQLEARATVWISLPTDSEPAALVKAPVALVQMLQAWDARLAGGTTDSEARFEASKRLAAVRGFRYISAGRMTKLRHEELLQRIEAVPITGNERQRIEAAALLGRCRRTTVHRVACAGTLPDLGDGQDTREVARTDIEMEKPDHPASSGLHHGHRRQSGKSSQSRSCPVFS